MAWWREARFGMFIHWGVYSVYGNVYDGLNVKGEQIHYNRANTGFPSEWIMYGAQIPKATYRQAAAEFDASEYNPKAWVQLAKQAGMKYVVVTTKHHDGFCLFDTDYTDWNAVDASAAGRDLLDELVKEVQAAGLKLGFYYSQNRDWMAEGGIGDIPELNFGLYPADKVMNYVDNLVIPQIKELTSRYNFDLFWFDCPNMSNSSDAIAKKIKDALMNSQVGTHVIVNDRLYTGWSGDFSSPESDTPNIPYNGYSDNRDWEACASLNDSWGWEDTAPPGSWKSPLYTISRILELSSKGGNFLLNVGPDKHGKIPEGATETLLGVGDWMSRNSSAVYGTSRNQLLNPFEFGYVTQKNEANGGVHWYLHVSTGYWDEGKVYLDGVMLLPESAKFLASGQTVEVKQQNFGLEITLPEVCDEPYYTVIDLYFNAMPPQKPSSPVRDGYEIRLTPFQGVTTSMKKDYIPYAFTRWTRAAHTIDFSVYLLPGTYKVRAEYASQYNPGTIYMTVNSIKHSLPYRKTGSMDDYVVDSYDFPIEIYRAETYNIRLSREQHDEIYNIVNLRNLVLTYTPPENPEPDQRFTIDPTYVTEGYFYCMPSQYDHFRLYDSSGRVHKTFEGEGSIPVDVSNLPAGVYIVRGQHGKQKIVINRYQRR
ncbi:MAG: alpha-L-fucosidase [Dysgonamonadaceae bacterium]|jgi:alpha-L-fucosidase|nr:alpha-L-fucosidase [Dysgonamonadaceae bacterium]